MNLENKTYKELTDRLSELYKNKPNLTTWQVEEAKAINEQLNKWDSILTKKTNPRGNYKSPIASPVKDYIVPAGVYITIGFVIGVALTGIVQALIIVFKL